jgi:hypothetical protein
MTPPILVKSLCLHLFGEKNLVVKEYNNLYLGLVTPSSGWYSPIITSLTPLPFATIFSPLLYLFTFSVLPSIGCNYNFENAAIHYWFRVPSGCTVWSAKEQKTHSRYQCLKHYVNLWYCRKISYSVCNLQIFVRGTGSISVKMCITLYLLFNLLFKGVSNFWLGSLVPVQAPGGRGYWMCATKSGHQVILSHFLFYWGCINKTSFGS